LENSDTTGAEEPNSMEQSFSCS